MPGLNNDFREFATFFQDGLNLRDAGGAIIPDANGRQGEDHEFDAEDQGEKGFNYSSTPFRHRLGGIEPIANPTPDATKMAHVFGSADNGDPDTPIFRAYTGDSVRMRA